MKREDLEKKYGKESIAEIIEGGYLEGDTMGIYEDGSLDIYEWDVERVIREIRGEKLNEFNWD